MKYDKLVQNFVHIAKLHRVLCGKRLSKMSPYAAQWIPVIRYVQENDGCTQAQLANFLRVTPASVALSTKRLQKAGYLDKNVDEYNLRCNQLHVTAQGTKLLEDCRGVFDATDAVMFQGFDEEELRVLDGYLNRIAANMGGGRRLTFGEILDIQKENEHN